ncbi:heme-dependent oxidative N-demethylase family protein [Thioclava sp.]|uniref:heme-dependent oxidative N-demethylase family protein n=1 Tax=Thioclava sp. TaxID=1933450 RepID=UPI003AA99986
MEPILQTSLSFAPWVDPRTRKLPGVVPLAPEDWLEVDSAYGAQMALRERLLSETQDQVHALAPCAHAAAVELYEMILALLPGLGFDLQNDVAICPDGREVALDRNAPLMTLGRLVQEDLCLLQSDPDDTGQGEHVLSGGVLCFPSGWRLREKFMRAMMRIHDPIEVYTDDLGRRVQRLMDGVQPGRGLMRGTASHSDAFLADPRSEYDYTHGTIASPFIRVERQGLVRLPNTRAVVFSIHTQIVRPESLSSEQAAALEEFPIRLAD